MLGLCFTMIVVKIVLSSEFQNSISNDSTKVLQMLIDCGGNVASLRNELEEMKEKWKLTEQVADTYTRWGRSTCPSGATTIYDGFTAGSHYTQSGGAANHVCLSKKPKYNFRSNESKWSTYIYGAEYETSHSILSSVHNREIPCAVCQVPRTSIIMVPGRDDCLDNFKIEYGGYLMAGHHTHAAASEFICMDGYPTVAEYSSSTSQDGALFYFVEAACGSLKCRPYKS